jgi:hypothetical protein
MKSKKLAIISTAAFFLSTSLAFAGDAHQQNLNTHHLSKRPYQDVPSNTVAKQKEGFDGATLVNEDGSAIKPEVSKHRQLRINMLGSRPYIEDVR